MNPLPEGPEPLPKMLTLAEVAEMLRVSRGRILALMRRGEFPPMIRPSREWIVRADLVTAWIAKREAASAAIPGRVALIRSLGRADAAPAPEQGRGRRGGRR